MTVYIVKKLWLDPMENSAGYALGYRSVGYVTDPITANRIVENSPIVDRSECWAMSGPMRRFIAEEAKEITLDELLRDSP